MRGIEERSEQWFGSSAPAIFPQFSVVSIAVWRCRAMTSDIGCDFGNLSSGGCCFVGRY